MSNEADVVHDTGTGGLPRITLTAEDGARMQIYLHGAHLTSWRPAREAADRLFLSANSQFADGVAIRGGVPICFPQFADQGPLPMHGFVRTAPWQLVRAGTVEGGGAQAVLRFTDSDVTRKLWPYAFALEYLVTVGGASLALELTATNVGDASFAFTGALHTYLRVVDVRRTLIRGLSGAHYRDKVLHLPDVVETAPELAIDRPLDRVYRAAPERLEVAEIGRACAIRATGFADTVVWNPGAEGGATIADLEPGGYSRMVCVEAAAAQVPVVVAAGARWRGTQTFVAR